MMKEKYISANSLKSTLNYFKREAGWGKEWNRCLDTVLETINDKPAEDVEPVIHACWIPLKEIPEYKCSACGRCLYCCPTAGERKMLPKRCDECGAVMDDKSKNKIIRSEEESHTYTAHEVACILADAFGDDCACNVNGNDEWLPQYCEFSSTCNVVGVACWEQYLKFLDRRKKQ